MVTIFLIDDDENLHQVYRAFFSMKGHEVIASAFDGAEAVSIYSRLNPKPDIILMDYRMPIKDGVTATREIKQIDSSSKIIFLSADETAQEAALNAGAIAFEIKPIRFANLLETIHKLVDSP